jgi:hypothetical protein
MGRCAEALRQSIEDPDAFWDKAVEGIDWYRASTTTMPVPGYDLHVADPATGEDVPPGCLRRVGAAAAAAAGLPAHLVG